jgi:hypothetical protein
MARLFPPMKPLLILHRGLVGILLAFSLAGCVADQKAALLACQGEVSHPSNEADQGSKNEHDYDWLAREYIREIKYVESCMAQKGYEMNVHQTMCGLESLKDPAPSDDPYCYAPRNRIAWLLYILESGSRPGTSANERFGKTLTPPKAAFHPEAPKQ